MAPKRKAAEDAEAGKRPRGGGGAGRGAAQAAQGAAPVTVKQDWWGELES